MNVRVVAAAVGAAVCVAGVAGGCGGSGRESASFADVQRVFAKYDCAACHPGVNPSLDLRPAKAYRELVGVRATEDPRLVRVVAGDPEKSFLFHKIAGEPELGDIPAIGARMPQGAPRMAQEDIDVVRDWIRGGARNAHGKTVGPAVPTPGDPGPAPSGDPATAQRGDATVFGVVEDERHRRLRDALVTLLLRGPGEEGGEEHYRVAVTDAAGRYELRHAPTGQYLLKAYAPRSIYVSRIVSIGAARRVRIDFGLPERAVPNPVVSAPSVERTATGVRVSMRVAGFALDPNYTLAVNPASGRVFELRHPGDGPGRWSRRVPERLRGRWLFLAVDHQCNISDFVTASG